MILFIGLLFTVALLFLIAVVCGQPAQWFIDIPSMLIIVLPLIFYFCVTKTGKVLGGYIKSSFQKKHEYGATELDLIVLAAKNTIKVTLASGFLGFIIGLIFVLGNLDNLEQLGRGLAVSLLTLFYAIATGYFIFFPVQAWAEGQSKLK